MVKRCSWCDENDPLYVHYHDHVWGVPVHDDNRLFEMLVLEGFQAGLSWKAILHRMKEFEAAFDEFVIEKVAQYDEKKVEELMHDPSIIRNRRKIQASIRNAQIIQELQRQYGSFDAWIWSFTDGKTIICDDPVSSPLSDEISKQMKKLGMSYVGTVIIHSFLSAVGIVNGHEKNCDWRIKHDTCCDL